MSIREDLVVEFKSEVQRRAEALRLVSEESMTVTGAAAAVGRSRRWLSKWMQRLAAGEGLEDRPRVPVTSPTALTAEMTDRVLGYRDRLEADPVASVGGLAILAAMEQDGIEGLPSVRSIERILTRHGRSRPRRRKRTRSTVPVLPLPVVGHQPGVWQQADWVQNRYLEGGIGYNSLQVTDAGSQGVAAGQYLRRTGVNAVTLLIEIAWPVLSIPHGISVDNAFTRTTHRNNPWTLWTRLCLFFGVEVIVSPPHELGWTNRVENINNLWQKRTIDKTHYNTLEDLRRGSNVFSDWANTRRPILNPTECGSRYPADLINTHRSRLRWPPDIAIADHLDRKGTVRVPLTTGRITFLRRVHDRHITIAYNRWPIDLPNHALVVASITTNNATLHLRHHGETLTTYPYPISRTVTDPYYKPQTNSLYHHA